MDDLAQPCSHFVEGLSAAWPTRLEKNTFIRLHNFQLRTRSEMPPLAGCLWNDDLPFADMEVNSFI